MSRQRKEHRLTQAKAREQAKDGATLTPTAQATPAIARPVRKTDWIGPVAMLGLLTLIGATGVAIWLTVDTPPPKLKPAFTAQLEQPPPPGLTLFKSRVNGGNRDALKLLGPAAVFDDEPVSPQEAEARYADHYLRLPELKIAEVISGEPDRAGKVQPAPDRFILVTKVEGSTPPLRVRLPSGEVEPPARLFIINPWIVVDVKDDKIHGVRVELNRE